MSLDTDDYKALSEEETEEQAPEEILPVFTAKTKLNAQLQLEASKALSPKIAKWLTYICLAIVVGMVAINVYGYIISGNPTSMFYAVLLLLVGLFLAYQKFLMPKVTLKKWEQSMRARFGTAELHLTAEFFEHSLAQSVEETGDVEQEGYSAISRIVETEHLYLLRRNRTLWFFIEKSGVSDGKAAALLPYLQERIGG